MGVLLLLDQLNHVDNRLLCRGAWEPDRIDFLKELILRQKRTNEQVAFLDIGAHGALYSLVLDRYINFDQIIAYEPEPESLAQIYANLLMNRLLQKVEVIPKAVSDKEGSAQFLVAHEGNRGQSRIAGLSVNSNWRSIHVDVTSVDATFHGIDMLLVAKVDVEGNEGNVVRGMTNTIRNNRIILQLEYNGENLLELDQNLHSLGVERFHSIGRDHYFIKN